MDDQEQYYLYPSAILVADKGLIRTVLGSCVAVCLFDSCNKRGGMNHFMLPLWNGEGLETPRYGNIAIPRLITGLLALGSRRQDLTAKIFGGGKLLGEENSYFQVGRKNIEIAQRLLSESGIPIVASSTGGTLGRRIWFDTRTGEVIQQYISKMKQH